MKLALGFDDVVLIPQYSEIKSRWHPSTSVTLKSRFNSDLDLDLEVPIMSANMDTISGVDMCKTMWDSGGIGCMHRNWSEGENVLAYEEVVREDRDCFVTLGVNDWRARASSLYGAGARYFILDIAHGHSLLMKEAILGLRKQYQDSIMIVAGNVATQEAVHDLELWGADIVKVGVGGGCFGAGTRILMSNGIYKNIEDIKIGEFVINKNGKPVKVLNSFCTGIKKVLKLRTNTFYKEAYVTPDHQYWVGDLNSNNSLAIGRQGYKKLLSKKTKTKPKGLSKYKWKSIGDVKQDCLLLPNKIDFNMPKSFKLDIYKRYPTGVEVDYTLEPSYDLGYVFGTFLGDGHAFINKCRPNSKIGNVQWYFGKNETHIVDKLVACLSHIFDKKQIFVHERSNIINVVLYYKPLADFLSSFGKRDKKHLPDDLFVDNKDYLIGLYDGLLDSDGCYHDRCVSFQNTSTSLIELFNVLNQILFGYMPNNEKKKPTAGGLIGCNVDNCKESYASRTLRKPKYRLTDSNQIVKILDLCDTEIEIPVYDLTVDCESHSFIANNAIVHNSICKTRLVTGHGYPMFSTILNCQNRSCQIIADGGIKNSGDIVKCFVAGADLVMIGSLLSGALETPGDVIDGMKVYRGMASHEAQSNTSAAAEGVSTLVKRKGPTALIINDLQMGLKSGMSYCNSNNLSEIPLKAKWEQQTWAAHYEGTPHILNNK